MDLVISWRTVSLQAEPSMSMTSPASKGGKYVTRCGAGHMGGEVNARYKDKAGVK